MGHDDEDHVRVLLAGGAECVHQVELGQPAIQGHVLAEAQVKGPAQTWLGGGCHGAGAEKALLGVARQVNLHVHLAPGCGRGGAGCEAGHGDAHPPAPPAPPGLALRHLAARTMSLEALQRAHGQHVHARLTHGRVTPAGGVEADEDVGRIASPLEQTVEGKPRSSDDLVTAPPAPVHLEPHAARLRGRLPRGGGGERKRSFGWRLRRQRAGQRAPERRVWRRVEHGREGDVRVRARVFWQGEPLAPRRSVAPARARGH